MEDPVTIFKLLLVGDCATGKTSLLQRLLTDEFERTYTASDDAIVRNVPFLTTRGKICFHCWDIPGKRTFSNSLDTAYVGGQCAIIMFDVTRPNTYDSVSQLYDDITRVCGRDLPLVLVGNKIDVENRRVKKEMIKFHRSKRLPYHEMSVKSNSSTDKPFLWIAKKLAGDPNLDFVPQHTPAQVSATLGGGISDTADTTARDTNTMIRITVHIPQIQSVRVRLPADATLADLTDECISLVPSLQQQKVGGFFKFLFHSSVLSSNKLLREFGVTNKSLLYSATGQHSNIDALKLYVAEQQLISIRQKWRDLEDVEDEDRIQAKKQISQELVNIQEKLDLLTELEGTLRATRKCLNQQCQSMAELLEAGRGRQDGQVREKRVRDS